MKKAITIIFLGILGYFGYQYYLTQGPTYACMEAFDAYENHDLEEFKRYVNIQSVSLDLAAQSKNKAGEYGKKEGNPFAGAIAYGLLGLMEASLAEAIEGRIIKAVLENEFGKKDSASDTEDIMKGKYQSVDVKEGPIQHGKTSINVLMRKRSEEGILKIDMQRVNGDWQVVRISNWLDFVEL
jgi:hypothetical protein